MNGRFRVASLLVLGLWPLGVTGQVAQPSGLGCPDDLPTLPTSPAQRTLGVPPPAYDLRCIELVPTARGGAARGMVEMRRIPSPFGVTVSPEGRHLSNHVLRIEGLPPASSLGAFTTYVAWATPVELDPVVKLGEVGSGTFELGTVDFNKYMILVSAEASADVTARRGPLVLRGLSPSTRMESHDMLALAPSAEVGPPTHDHEMGGWTMPPDYPGVTMMSGMAGIRPSAAPLSVAPPAGSAPVPEARPGEVVTLPNGGTLDLTAGFVRRRVAGRDLVMLGFNGQHPGPLVRVGAGTTIFVNFRNQTPFPTAVHWHGVRLDNRFDGVPHLTQDPVEPGGTFQYRVHFPDAGIYWYHPHHREDVQQEMGLYGNLLVEPLAADYYGPANREQVLMLDDLLLDDAGIVQFGGESANYALMGRFGNVALVNGEPSYTLRVSRGEVVRFFLTNASSARTWNLSFRAAAGSPLPLKVVATDVGKFEREERARSVVLGPAERFVIDVRFDEPGEYQLVNHVQGINHRVGVFRGEVTRLGAVTVDATPAVPDHGSSFETLRENRDVIGDIDRVRAHFGRTVDHEIVLSMDTEGLPLPIEQAMRWDWVYFNPVEWTDLMSMMSWATTGREVKWMVREPSTGRVNEEIAWRFRVGDVVKVRVHNDRSAFHAMQHPLHFHGQRFLVLSQDGVANTNLAWKDTVLLPTGSTTDILLELSNPGRWMAHCHIAEHLESGMKFVFEVEGAR